MKSQTFGPQRVFLQTVFQKLPRKLLDKVYQIEKEIVAQRIGKEIDKIAFAGNEGKNTLSEIEKLALGHILQTKIICFTCNTQTFLAIEKTYPPYLKGLDNPYKDEELCFMKSNFQIEYLFYSPDGESQIAFALFPTKTDLRKAISLEM